MYVTRQRLRDWQQASELTAAEADAAIVKVRAFVQAINAAPYNGLFNEADSAEAAPVASALGITYSDLLNVAKLADAAGLVRKVS